ncbi:WD40-repeat-containing domain protein [Camillea tinctor]|nr:WD40-repeat-containing domain protein [Camillea tinctor]
MLKASTSFKAVHLRSYQAGQSKSGILIQGDSSNTSMGYLPSITWLPPPRKDGCLVTASEDGVLLLSVDSALCALADYADESQEPIKNLDIISDGRMIAGSQLDGSVFIEDFGADSARRKVQPGHNGSVSALAFSPSGNMLLTGSADSTLRGVAWSAQEDYVASASEDGSVRVWKIGQEKQLITLDFPQSEGYRHEPIYAVAFSPDGRYIVAGTANAKVVVWEQTSPENWKHQHTIVGHKEAVQNVLISLDSKSVISASSDQTLRIYDLDTGAPEQLPIKIEWEFFKMWQPPPSNDYFASDSVMTPNGIQPLRVELDVAQPPVWSPWRLRHDHQNGQWWITFKGRNVIFIPKSLRPSAALISGEKMIIGTETGETQMLEFSKTIEPPIC